MNLHIGPAGWRTRMGKVPSIPSGLRRKIIQSRYLAQYFDLIEINTSFYGHIWPEVGKLWCKKAKAVNPIFLLTT